MPVVIQNGDFDVAAEYQNLCESAPRAGAVVFFVGLVRDLYSNPEGEDSTKNTPETVDHIELSHYAGMTESLCETIVANAKSKFPFDAARVVHRVGKLYAGDQIVFIGVASRHRSNAFSAAQFIMDYLKTEATLWKKEVGSRGEHWLGIKQQDKSAAKRWQTDTADNNDRVN